MTIVTSHYRGGIAPWGWIKGADGELVPIPEQQTAIARMRQKRTEGVSLRKIMERMVDEGHAITLPTLMRLTAQHLPRVGEKPRGGALPFGYQQMPMARRECRCLSNKRRSRGSTGCVPKG
jgi:hypothetical protein